MKRRPLLVTMAAVILIAAVFFFFRCRESAPPVRSPSPAPPAPLAGPASPVRPEPARFTSPGASGKSPILSPAEIERIRSAAKVSLAANYAAQKSFHAEYGRYTTDLNAAGWAPDEFPLAYKAGFLQPARPLHPTPTEDPRLLDTDALFASPEFRRPEGPLYTAAAEGIALSSLGAYCQMGCTAGERSFEMLIAFNLDADPTLEVWRINDKKEIEQVVDDLKN